MSDNDLIRRGDARNYLIDRGHLVAAQIIATLPAVVASQPADPARVAVNDIAKIVYEAIRFMRHHDTPEWVDGGNSLAQTEARQKASRILAALAAVKRGDA